MVNSLVGTSMQAESLYVQNPPVAMQFVGDTLRSGKYQFNIEAMIVAAFLYQIFSFSVPVTVALSWTILSRTLSTCFLCDFVSEGLRM